MTDVSVTFSNGGIPLASDLNTMAAELVGLATAIEASQLLGGITSDLLADRFAPDHILIPLLPFTSGNSLAAPAGFTLPGAATVILPVQPFIRPGYQCYLCGIKVHVLEADTAAGNAFRIRFRLNGSTIIGGQEIQPATDNQWYIIGNADVFTQMLVAMAEGDYINIELWQTAGATPRGVTVEMLFKHQLTS